MTNRRSPNPHAITEHAMLLATRRHADFILRNPDLVVQVKSQVEGAITSRRCTAGLELWYQLLGLPLPEVVQQMTEDSPNGRLLRSNNPFSSILPSENEDTRKQLWRLAKTELSNRAT